MRLIVTGKRGQVVQCLLERARERPEFEVVTLARPELDLSNLSSISPAIMAARPDIVVSAAAYTAVDQAEDEPELAFRINAEAAGELARAARMSGARIIHISTDHVFSGGSGQPYVEDDPTGPLNVYGHSKLAGEEAVRNSHADHLILRTGWVYSPFGKNFMKTMLQLATSQERIGVVDDQFGNPTSALDVAEAVLTIAARWDRESRDFGTFHFAGAGGTSRYEFAREIFRASQGLGGPSAKLIAVPTSSYPTRAVRPADTRLDCTTFAESFDLVAPDWKVRCTETVEAILAASAARSW